MKESLKRVWDETKARGQGIGFGFLAVGFLLLIFRSVLILVGVAVDVTVFALGGRARLYFGRHVGKIGYETNRFVGDAR